MTSYLTSVDWNRIGGAIIGRFAEGHGLILVFLFSTIVFGIVVTFAQTRPRSFRDLWRHILPPGTVGHPSTRTDYLFWLSKRITMPPLILVLGVSTATAGHVAYSLLTRVFGPAQHPTDHAGFWVMAAFTACMLIVYDFGNYTFHRLQHRLPVLWELHKTHHSAQRMVGVTKDRVHPVEEILSRWWTGMISGPVYGIWLYYLVDPVELTV
ncbi:MAG TPA: sterol desaturase family protein, partial [Rhodopila sp.]|nr:sterol desaturase family protein [Rhodopila sp.]